MSILANRIFYVNGENRIEGTPSDFTYQIDVPDGADFDSVCVLSMTVPRSYYLVHPGYNTFRLIQQNVEPVLSHVITVPPGNYKADNFVDMILPLLNAFGTFTMSYQPMLGKYLFTTTAPVTLEFYSTLALQFGFDEQSSNSVSGTFMSPNVVDFVATSTVFLHSDMVDDSTSILQEVYSDNTIPFSKIVYHCQFPGMYTKTLTKKGSKVFKFSLTDEHQNTIDLNGHNILVTLLMYKKENLTRLLRQIFPPGQSK